MHEIPKPFEPHTPIEDPQQTPEHVPELPPIHDPDPQQEEARIAAPVLQRSPAALRRH
jgi:hypothetical protein